MAEFYFDHNVTADAVSPLQTLGHDVVTARIVGLSEAKDDEQLLFAAQQHRVLITYNAKDFQLLHDAWRRWSLVWQVQFPHRGILIVPQPPRWGAARLADELHAFVQARTDLSNELYQFFASSGWVRRPLPRSPQMQP